MGRGRGGDAALCMHVCKFYIEEACSPIPFGTKFYELHFFLQLAKLKSEKPYEEMTVQLLSCSCVMCVQ